MYRESHTTLAAHWTWCAHAPICRYHQSTSSTSICPIIGCYGGSRHTTSCLHYIHYSTMASTRHCWSVSRSVKVGSLPADTRANLDLDGLTQLYEDVNINVLDRFIPLRTVRCRVQTTSFGPVVRWRMSGCQTPDETSGARRSMGWHVQCRRHRCCHRGAEWRPQRWVYCDLRNQKRESFWWEKVA